MTDPVVALAVRALIQRAARDARDLKRKLRRAARSGRSVRLTAVEAGAILRALEERR